MVSVTYVLLHIDNVDALFVPAFILGCVSTYLALHFSWSEDNDDRIQYHHYLRVLTWVILCIVCLVQLSFSLAAMDAVSDAPSFVSFSSIDFLGIFALPVIIILNIGVLLAKIATFAMMLFSIVIPFLMVALIVALVYLVKLSMKKYVGISANGQKTWVARSGLMFIVLLIATQIGLHQLRPVVPAVPRDAVSQLEMPRHSSTMANQLSFYAS
ncbi:MAG: hypothetical protein HOM11_06080 [Methylococcales bacterium]|nr:hypothetical protein [Methylococcales bacterium]MBT7445232.1 hypothetical protein [Methylococcales bacterium]